MAIGSGLFEPSVALVARVLPAAVRRRLADGGMLTTGFYADLLKHGGRRGFVDYAQRLGYRGKWICDDSGPSHEGADLAEELGHRWLEMKSRQRAVASPYLPAEAWSASLDLEWQVPRHAIESGDWSAFHGFLCNFFRNGAISGLWGLKRMFETFAECSAWDDLRRLALFLRQYEAWRRESPGGSLDDLDEPRVGNPWGYDMGGRLVAEPTVEYHSFARRLRDLVAGVSAPVIVEIGGGYGGLGRQLVQAIPGLRYIGIDLPENITLQAWYLARSLPGRAVRLWTDAPGTGNLPRAEVSLLPNWALAGLELDRVDVLVNVHSFSEMKHETLERYFAQIVRLSPEWVYHDNLAAERLDGCPGIPSTEFPALTGYRLTVSCESRWPRYRHDSPYPCREYLFRRSPA